jgi:hypothetical protein
VFRSARERPRTGQPHGTRRPAAAAIAGARPHGRPSPTMPRSGLARTAQSSPGDRCMTTTMPAASLQRRLSLAGGHAGDQVTSQRSGGRRWRPPCLCPEAAAVPALAGSPRERNATPQPSIRARPRRSTKSRPVGEVDAVVHLRGACRRAGQPGHDPVCSRPAWTRASPVWAASPKPPGGSPSTWHGSCAMTSAPNSCPPWRPARLHRENPLSRATAPPHVAKGTHTLRRRERLLRPTRRSGAADLCHVFAHGGASVEGPV